MNQSLAWVYELMNMLSFQDKRFSYHKIRSHMDGYFINGGYITGETNAE